jgi:UDP-N-acetyl-alpha-D-quinovosamine dehydrogenase
MHESHAASLRIAVTGAHGFVGRELNAVLQKHGCKVLAIGRPDSGGPVLDDSPGWQRVLAGADAVIHLAARAHVLREAAAQPLEEFRKVNVQGALCVARAAVAAGARRFVFVSSIGVLGNETAGVPFSESTPPRPVEPYAVSKYEAEQGLKELEEQTGLEVAIVRPPLIYGPYVKGNFLRLLKLVAAGIPLPLGAINNHRSFIGVTNVSELLFLCAVRPLGVQRLFVASDGHDISTPELLGMLAALMRRTNRVFWFPNEPLRLLAAAVGRAGEYRRLASDLTVDSRLAREVLEWQPGKSLEAGMAEMVNWFVQGPR